MNLELINTFEIRAIYNTYAYVYVHTQDKTKLYKNHVFVVHNNQLIGIDNNIYVMLPVGSLPTCY